MPKKTKKFQCFKMADISTGHVTEEDGRLMGMAGDVPGRIANLGTGSIFYVPMDQGREEVMRDMARFGFSSAFLELLDLLAEDKIDYVYFDGAGTVHDWLRQFEW